MIQFLDAWVGLYQGERSSEHWREGQGLVEYALILSFIAIAVIIALVAFGSRLTQLYSKLGNSIPT